MLIFQIAAVRLGGLSQIGNRIISDSLFCFDAKTWQCVALFLKMILYANTQRGKTSAGRGNRVGLKIFLRHYLCVSK